jgi:hypothetical protein
MRRNSLNPPVTITQPTSGQCPSLPLRLHKEKDDENHVLSPFCYPEITFFPQRQMWI